MGDVAVGWCAALNGPAPYYMVMVWSDEVPLRVVTVRSGLVSCGPVLYDAASVMLGAVQL